MRVTALLYMQVFDGEKVYSGELSVTNKMEETSSFKLTSNTRDEEELVNPITVEWTPYFCPGGFILINICGPPEPFFFSKTR